jgi:type VI protein secretion system component VasF
MAPIAMEKEAAKMDAEAEVQRLLSELEALKKDFAARLSSLEAHLPKTEAPAEEQVSVETLAVIAAAVTAFLGKKVKIRSAHLSHTVTPWAQAGRAIVQASHNLNR